MNPLHFPKEKTIYYPILLFVVISGLSVSRVQSVILDGAGRNSTWIFFPSLLLIWLGTWCSLQVSRRNGNQSIMQACGQIVFRFLTPVAYLMYGLLFLGTAIYYVVVSGDFFSRTLLYADQTNLMVIGAVMSTLFAFFPMETFAKYAHLLMIVIVPSFLIISLTPLINTRWSWLVPVINSSEMVHMDHALAGVMLVFSPLAAMTIIIRRPGNRTTFFSLLILTFCIALYASFMLAMGITTFGVHTAKEFSYLGYATVSAVRIENFVFERIVFLGILLWKYFEVVGSAFLIRCAALGMSQTFGWRLGVFPISLVGLIAVIVVWNINIPFFFLKYAIWLGYYALFLLVIFPLLIYIIMLIRGKST